MGLGKVKPTWRVDNKRRGGSVLFFIFQIFLAVFSDQEKRKKKINTLWVLSDTFSNRTAHFEQKKNKYVFSFSLFFVVTVTEICFSNSCSKITQISCSGCLNKVGWFEKFSKTNWRRRATIRGTRVIQWMFNHNALS